MREWHSDAYSLDIVVIFLKHYYQQHCTKSVVVHHISVDVFLIYASQFDVSPISKRFAVLCIGSYIDIRKAQ